MHWLGAVFMLSYINWMLAPHTDMTLVSIFSSNVEQEIKCQTIP